jgi:crotonobetaine/carnitine-CoA ligase
MAVIVLKPNETVDPADLTRFLIDRLPYFMVPRYLQFVAELPKTPTQKIQKEALRATGVNASTWDRERAGIRVTRDS